MPEQAPKRPGWSLEGRIKRRLLLMLGLLWFAGSVVSMGGIWHESGAVLDSALNETAERFLYLPESVIHSPEDQELFLGEIGPHEEHVVYQVFDSRNVMVLRSHQAPEKPLDEETEDGIRDVEGWHVLTKSRNDGRRRVAVAESVGHRFEVLWGSVGWLFGTLLLVLPAASYGLTRVLRKAFGSLEPARTELTHRAPDDLRPIESPQAPQELRPWLESVNSLMARDRVLIEAERSFAARTAHELRTPLAAARAQAQRMVEMVHEPGARQHGTALVRQLDRLARLATRLLQLARIESRVSTRREPVDLVMLAKLVVSDFPEALAGGRIRLEIASEDTGVIGDIDAIGIALRNLIDNALKHGGEDGRIVVLVETLSVYVINDGPGVPPEILAKLVRPFERGITAAEGSGLGLSITSAIVHQAGGTLDLLSPVLGDRGFCAVLRFD